MVDDVRVRRAASRADFDSCVLLQRAVWGLSDLEITSAIQLIATTHAGGLVHLAESVEGQAVGFAYAFPAIRGGTPHLHSDMLAVVPEYQQRRSEEHTSELQSLAYLVCRLLLEKKKMLRCAA